MTGHFERFREFKGVYNQHTCSQVNPTTGAIEKNFNGICINNSVGCLDWNVGEWFAEETEVLKTFLEGMKKFMADRTLPPPAKNQNIKEIQPPMVANVKGAAPSVTAGLDTSTSSKKPPMRMEMTPDSWTHLKQTAKSEPMLFLTHPRNLVKYQKVPVKIPTLPTS